MQLAFDFEAHGVCVGSPEWLDLQRNILHIMPELIQVMQWRRGKGRAILKVEFEKGRIVGVPMLLE